MRKKDAKSDPHNVNQYVSHQNVEELKTNVHLNHLRKFVLMKLFMNPLNPPQPIHITWATNQKVLSLKVLSLKASNLKVSRVMCILGLMALQKDLQAPIMDMDGRDTGRARDTGRGTQGTVNVLENKF